MVAELALKLCAAGEIRLPIAKSDNYPHTLVAHRHKEDEHSNRQ
jgi:hypothetical protein